MAKSEKEFQLIPSGGVLLVAAAAAVVAAILVNIYISGVKGDYLGQTSKEFLQVTQDVSVGTPWEERFLKKVRFPPQLLKDGDFSTACEPKELGLILRKPAKRDFSQGEILTAGDAIGIRKTAAERVPAGYLVADIHLNQETAFPKLLQPGSFVSILGDFDTSVTKGVPRVEVMVVIPSVRVWAIDGETSAAPASRTVEFIQIAVKEAQVQQLMQIQKYLISKRYSIALAPPQEVESAPVIKKEVIDYVTLKLRGQSAAEAGAALAPAVSPEAAGIPAPAGGPAPRPSLAP